MWYLYAAQQQLAGTMLYGPHLVDTNPPLIIWFSTVPVLISRLLHIRPDAGLNGILAIMILGSVLWSVRILRKTPQGLSASYVALLGCAVIVAEFAQFVGTRLHFAGFQIAGYSLGQREHLLVILIFPYVLARATRAAQHLGWAERCALGIAAGIGICFKPQQALILVALELFFVLYTRRPRHVLTPEALAAVLIGVCYVLLVRLVTPVYITQIMPLLRDTYGAFGGLSLKFIYQGNRRNAASLLVSVAASLLLLHRLRDRVTVYALLACVSGATAAFLLQHKGWMYQFRPVSAFYLFLLIYVICGVLEPVLRRLDAEWPKRPVLATAALTCVVALLLVQTLDIRKNMALAPASFEQLPAADDLFAQLTPGTPVYVLSATLAVFPTVYRHHLGWGGRFPCLWMLPAIIRNETGSTEPGIPFKRLPPENVVSLANLQRTDTAEDLDYWRPAVILVEQCNASHPCSFFLLKGYDFDMLAWFLKSAQFRSAWSHYQQQSPIPGFTVYRRID
ncbi:MAG TPA: hypothetical protein VF018_08010 [Acidobacteriaceae bacterium]